MQINATNVWLLDHIDYERGRFCAWVNWVNSRGELSFNFEPLISAPTLVELFQLMKEQDVYVDMNGGRYV